MAGVAPYNHSDTSILAAMGVAVISIATYMGRYIYLSLTDAMHVHSYVNVPFLNLT